MMPQSVWPTRWPWLPACCLAAAAALFQFRILAPAEARVAELQRAAASRAHVRATPIPLESVTVLPSEAMFPDLLGQIVNAALDAGIPIDEGSYQVVRLARERVVRYEITLPLRLTYPQLRALVDELRADLPAVVVENVQLNRQKVGDELLDARLRLVVSMEAKA